MAYHLAWLIICHGLSFDNMNTKSRFHDALNLFKFYIRFSTAVVRMCACTQVERGTHTRKQGTRTQNTLDTNGPCILIDAWIICITYRAYVRCLKYFV